MVCGQRRLLLPAFILVAGSFFLSSCKPRTGRSQLRDDENSRLTTTQLQDFLHGKLTQQQEKVRSLSTGSRLYFDGDDIAEDVWDFYIDTSAVRALYPGSVGDMRNHRDFFGVRLSQLQVCQGHDRVDPADPTKGCYSYDNLMRYKWNLRADGEHLRDSRDWYVHLIRQRYGSAQPDMLRFIKNGDIAVYVHPENRADDLGTTLQWRATHAATIMERNDETGQPQLLTVDTPTGYAQPFNGADDTPFHVFRFVPVGFEVEDAAAEQAREMGVKWGTLGFGEFEFEGDYRLMGNHMRSPADLQKFADGYLRAARDEASGLPNMYCAWYTYLNLSLGWARPFTPDGMGPSVFESLTGKTLNGLTPTHRFAAGNFDKGYAVPQSLWSRFPRRSEFPFNPMSSPELIMGYLDQLVMPDALVDDPRLFKMVAMQKAGILAGLAQNTDVHYNFFVEQNDRGAPPDDVNHYNKEVVTQFKGFVEAYSKAAAMISDEDIAAMTPGADATRREAALQKLARIKADLAKPAKALVRKELDAEGQMGRISRRFIPPYAFVRHAEDHDSYYPNFEIDGLAPVRRERPVLIYVGTVMHEKFLRTKGQAPGAKRIAPVPRTTLTAVDSRLDDAMYQIMGCAAKGDGNGYLAFLKYVSSADYKCDEAAAGGAGSESRILMNKFESEAMRSMMTDWRDARKLSQRDIFVRNTFGLDPVLTRRLLASWWRDPTKHFKPAIYAGEASSIDSAVSNLRVLLQNPVAELADQQATEDFYTTKGHPRVKHPVPCLKRGDPSSVSSNGRVTCDFLALSLSQALPAEENNPEGVN